ncbi:MAG TPA: hypothetical protein VFP36_01625 [Usitatibacter sp.]|nr:hypothetical protein [Usitatibacter sp.]
MMLLASNDPRNMALMQAIGRLMGLALAALAVEMLLAGIRAFVEGLR